MEKIKLMKTIAIIGTLMAGAGLALAQTTNSESGGAGGPIPVGNPVGLVSTTDVSDIAAGSTISSITVNLDISGGFNGSLYAYLSGPNGGFDVLLNQPGSSGGSIGYLDNGLNLTLDDSAANNIQTYETTTGVLAASTQLTGAWQSAGNTLSSFAGTDPAGTWTLFVANLTGGSPQSTLTGWSMTIVTAVPEPQTWAMCAAGAFMLFAGFKWRGKIN
jgi:subtilisin-like proprotein convertase family protein